MNIEINPEDINKFIIDAVIKSALGEQINIVITEEIKELASGWDSPIRKAIQGQIAAIVSQTLREQFKAQIEAAVAEKLTEAISAELISDVWDKYYGEKRR